MGRVTGRASASFRHAKGWGYRKADGQTSTTLFCRARKATLTCRHPLSERPLLNVFFDSDMSWREKAESLFRQHCDTFLKKVAAKVDDDVARGVLTRIERSKDRSSPLTLRYEWAARRYCYNEPYKDLATNEYSPSNIQKAVSKIFEDTAIRSCPKRK